MSVFDIFKKKVTEKEQIKAVVPVEPAKETVTEDKPKKTDAELFEEWYANLTPEMRKKVDKKMEKLIIRAGTPVCCKKCGKPGSNKVTGPFRKIKDGYVHQNCMPEGLNG
jgi:hypothetical protein